jgi:hypothetical protein
VEERWAGDWQKFIGSSRSKSFNGFKRVEQFERFKPQTHRRLPSVCAVRLL